MKYPIQVLVPGPILYRLVWISSSIFTNMTSCLGKDISSLRLLVGKLVKERKAAIEAEANDTGRGNTETDLTNKIDIWIEFLADIDAKEAAKKMSQEERERSKQLANKRRRALLLSAQGSSAMVDSDDNADDSTPGRESLPASTPALDDNDTDTGHRSHKKARITGRTVTVTVEGMDVVADAIDGLGDKVSAAMTSRDERIDTLIMDMNAMKTQMSGLVKAEDLMGMEERIALMFSGFTSSTLRHE